MAKKKVKKTAKGKSGKKTIKQPKFRKKAVKKKVVQKKAVKRKRTALPMKVHGLQAKKLQIMDEIPIMPCSAISKDRQGARYCHTQAAKVYATYRKACSMRGLTIRRVSGLESKAEYQDNRQDLEGKWIIQISICSKYEGVWEIRDSESGESETFCGAGYGDNYVWSCNSAQTVAKKQALLDYFEVCWPEPEDYLAIVKQTFDDLNVDNFKDAFKRVMPDKVRAAPNADKVILDFFASLGI